MNGLESRFWSRTTRRALHIHVPVVDKFNDLIRYEERSLICETDVPLPYISCSIRFLGPSIIKGSRQFSLAVVTRRSGYMLSFASVESPRSCILRCYYNMRSPFLVKVKSADEHRRSDGHPNTPVFIHAHGLLSFRKHDTRNLEIYHQCCKQETR